MPSAPMFQADQLTELLSLIKESDSVELKVSIPEAHQRSTVAALGMDPLTAQIRQVYFFDTPELALDKQGVVARARRIQNAAGDSVVKLRPVVPAEVPAELRKSSSYRIEVDALPGGYVCSGTLKGSLVEDPRLVAAGKLPVRKLFSKEQRAYFADHTDGISLDDLTVLGPIFVLKLRFTPGDFERRLVAELWFYPDGSRILELSTRCSTTEAFQVAAETRAYLGSKGIDLSGDQATKTRKALQYFAKAMKEGS